MRQPSPLSSLLRNAVVAFFNLAKLRASSSRLVGKDQRAVRIAKRGFTLLEVILALAILGLALATLGYAVGRSHDNARRVANETELAQIAASVLDEVVGGIRPFIATALEPISDPDDPTGAPRATATVSIEPTPYQGLFAVRVRVSTPVTRSDVTATPLDTVELVRWMIDPSALESSEASTL